MKPDIFIAKIKRKGRYDMKEQIYTIPLNEAYDKNCGCPLCYLEKKLEKEGIDYALGAAMMEPDYRTDSNKTGYCRNHFTMMFAKPNKLSLALVLDTHLEEIRNSLAKMDKRAQALGEEKGGIFKKSSADSFIEEAVAKLGEIEDGCMICKKINHTMERYADVLLYLWDNDEKFREKFDRSSGLCIPHSRLLLKNVKKSLPEKSAKRFISALWKKQTEEMSKLQEDIHKFTLKFDYRNKDMPWGTAQDAPVRTINRIAGSIEELEDEE